MTTQSEPTPAPVLPPPRTEVGILGWVLANLFSNRFNSALTIISAAVVVLALWFGLRWVFVDADWRVISTLGGLMFMGPYNTDAACPGNDCFWRPQVSLLLVSVLLGMVWGIAGSPTAKRLALLTSGVLLLLAFLPYSFERMGMDVRLLLAANLPAVGVGWAIAKSPTAMRVSLMAVGTFVLLAFFLYSYEYLGTDVTTLLAAVLLAASLLALGVWWTTGSPGTKGVALTTAGIFVVLAFFLYSFGRLDRIVIDVRLLLDACLLVVGVWCWALARSKPPGMVPWISTLTVAIFVITVVLLLGIEEIPGLQPVAVANWGGLTLNLLLAVAGIALSLPIGIALALGRRSNLPVVKLLCVVFIEIFRGVPLITLLFMSQVLVPLAFPHDAVPDALIRAAIVIILFSSAYMAENVRGGLQALHAGQAEAARALGLPAWQTMLNISLPQAIRNVIPAIVGQFISLFKDTSLIYIIGMLDVVEISRAFIQGNTEFLASAQELFIFLALLFWIFTYTMSYVSRRVERHLGVGVR